MELSTDRQIGFGIGPIPYSSILTFCAHKDLGAEETEDLPNVEEIENFADSQEIPTENYPHAEKVLSQSSPPEKFIKEVKEKKKTKKPSSVPKRASKSDSEKKKVQITKESSFDSERVPERKEKKWFESEGQLVIDVYQTNGEIVIQSAIAGVKPEDLDISIENDMVTIKGSREKTLEKGNRNYFYQECHWGCFSREIILPVEVDSGRAEAMLKDGILTIRIPKIEREGKKKIAVKE